MLGCQTDVLFAGDRAVESEAEWQSEWQLESVGVAIFSGIGVCEISLTPTACDILATALAAYMTTQISGEGL